MKLKNILSVLGLLVMMVSCSMEDETVLNDIDKEIQDNVEAYAYFDLNLVGEGSMTKSSSIGEGENPNSTESVVHNCYLAIFDTNSKQLLNSFYYVDGTIEPVSGEDYTYSLGSHFQIKVSKDESKRPDLTFVAIANINHSEESINAGVSSLAALKACKTYGDLMAETILENPTVLVKKGEKTISKSDYLTSSSTSNHNDYCTSVTIPVYQRSAAVELSEFTVKAKKSDGTFEELKATDVTFNLYNVNLYTKVDAGATDVDNIEEKPYSDDKAMGSRFYTYENTTTTKTYMKVSYTLNGIEETTRALYIQTPVNGTDVEKVLANHLYKLNVTVINGVAKAECTVNDWIPNTINGEWKEE